MPSKKPHICTYLAQNEYDEVVESATKAGLSLSAFARNCCLGIRMQHVTDAAAVRDLIKINADMGRLGGLLKLYLTMPEVPTQQVRPLLKEIEALKRVMERKVLEL
jgi:hypothetical protein